MTWSFSCARTQDTSNDGSIDAAELKCALRKAVGADLSLEDCTKLVQRFDKDGTGTLDFGEFRGICKLKSE